LYINVLTHTTQTLIKQKIIPIPATESSKNISKEKIITLQQAVYEDIKEVIYQVGKAIERKPSLYKNKKEEDLRDIFLLFLETRYDSTSGVGEAFNKKGKTDILLKYSKDGTNLFVAECKVWNGQKKFLEALDQLLGYLTHRDSKTSLILFVKQNEMTNILQNIKTVILKHPNFFKYLKDTYEHSISYEFFLPEDTNKKIQIEVTLFHFPLK
jgi:rRNA pseudouridine-1189 N-methylase Emg1 (Nep1/Mra1 family)